MVTLRIVLLKLLVGASVSLAQQPVGEVARRESTPDLPQVQKVFPGRGSVYCGPVSASNGLVYLARQGFSDLLPDDQYRLVNTLGSKPYMNTALMGGTGATSMIRGLNGYVQKCGYDCEIRFQGWRHVDNEAAKTLVGHASIAQIERWLQPDAIVLLNIGWYQKAESEFRRLGGHWVTLVGVVDHNLLLIHDPSNRSPEGDCERVLATRIDAGVLTGRNKGLPRTAVDAWELGGDLKIKTSKGANTCVLDGAVFLRLRTKE